MIPTGYINYACDENTVNNALLRGDVVLVINDNIDERIYPSDNVIHASILLPPFESICLLIDDTKDAFAISYSDYLLSRETDLYHSRFHRTSERMSKLSEGTSGRKRK